MAGLSLRVHRNVAIKTMSIRIKRHLQSCYPEIADLLGGMPTVPKLKRRDMPLPEALVRVVAGQMLSARAATTIYERVRSRAQSEKLAGSWLLDHDSLRACGLSGGKARAICELAARVGSDPGALNHWYALPPDELVAAIKEQRGLGDWTASIISLFYIGHEDIFPAADGSIRRAIALIEGKSGKRRVRRFDPDVATPYRSYLAMYLWRALDAGLLASHPGK